MVTTIKPSGLVGKGIRPSHFDLPGKSLEFNSQQWPQEYLERFSSHIACIITQRSEYE